MLKEQIEKSFYITYPKKPNCLVNITEEQKIGVFVLYDNEACKGCARCIADETQKVNIHISSTRPVFVVRMNQVLSYLKERVGKNCDAILANDDMVIFLEMTCSEPHYVTPIYGKRSKAISQLKNTIGLFELNPDLSAFMKARSGRYMILSWKDTSQPVDEADSVERGYTAFTDLADEVYSVDNVRMMDNGFIFKEIHYPDILQIDDLLD